MNMKMSFCSLIIPVYNVEKYLDNCIRSVILQRPKKNGMEILLIDDGSTDNSAKICDEYVRQYDFIKVIHKQNGGLSSARNVGLKQANGQYVMFMDSDDWWNPDVQLGQIFSYVKEHEYTEMFLFDGYDFIEGDGYYRRNDHDHFQNINTESTFEYYKSLLRNGNLEVSACTKILKRSFLLSNSLFFKDKLLSEDNEWMMRILRVVKSIDIINEPFYICRLKRADSITNNIEQQNIEDLLRIVYASQKYYNAKSEHELKELELCYCAYLWFSALGLSNLLSKNEKYALKRMFKKTSGVCMYSNSPKTKLCYCIYRVFGFALTGKVLGLYIRLKGSGTLNRTKVPDVSPIAA